MAHHLKLLKQIGPAKKSAENLLKIGYTTNKLVNITLLTNPDSSGFVYNVALNTLTDNPAVGIWNKAIAKTAASLAIVNDTTNALGPVATAGTALFQLEAANGILAALDSTIENQNYRIIPSFTHTDLVPSSPTYMTTTLVAPAYAIEMSLNNKVGSLWVSQAVHR